VRGLLGAAVLALLYARSLAYYYFDPAYAKAPVWREVMAVLHTQPGPNDLIIRNFPDPAFDYYYRGSVPTTTLPAAENPPATETNRTLRSLSQQHDYIWFLPIDSAAFDRERSVALWLDANMLLISDQWIGPTRILQYAPWDRLPSPILTSSTSFGNTVQLLATGHAAHIALEKGAQRFIWSFSGSHFRSPISPHRVCPFAGASPPGRLAALGAG
jgi:hypothetical protein